MSIYLKAKIDNQRILNKGFSETFTINNGKSGLLLKSQTIKGFYIDVALNIDPNTGLPIVGQHVGISLNLSDITINATNDNFEGFIISWTNAKGETRKGRWKNIMQDRTLNMITFTVTIGNL